MIVTFAIYRPELTMNTVRDDFLTLRKVFQEQESGNLLGSSLFDWAAQLRAFTAFNDKLCRDSEDPKAELCQMTL